MLLALIGLVVVMLVISITQYILNKVDQRQYMQLNCIMFVCVLCPWCVICVCFLSLTCYICVSVSVVSLICNTFVCVCVCVFCVPDMLCVFTGMFFCP